MASVGGPGGVLCRYEDSYDKTITILIEVVSSFFEGAEEKDRPSSFTSSCVLKVQKVLGKTDFMERIRSIQGSGAVQGLDAQARIALEALIAEDRSAQQNG